MIKHVVMFRIKEAEGLSKEENIIKAQNLLKSLPSKIDLIREYQVGINAKESERAGDIVLISAFDNMEKLAEYSSHPEHQAVVSFLKKVWYDVMVVDYEY